MKIVWQDHAKAELREAVHYYRVHAGHAVAKSFADEIHRMVRRLWEQPGLGMRYGEEIRRYPLHDYPYHVVYRLMSKEVIVVALAHQRRRPGYWAGRR